MLSQQPKSTLQLTVSILEPVTERIKMSKREALSEYVVRNDQAEQEGSLAWEESAAELAADEAATDSEPIEDSIQKSEKDHTESLKPISPKPKSGTR